MCGKFAFFQAKSTVPNNDDRTENVMAEWGDNNMDALSAESVALSLIAKFSDKQLPKASDLLWLVSEQVSSNSFYFQTELPR